MELTKSMSSEANEVLDLRGLTKILWDGRWLLALIVAVSTGTAIVVAFASTEIYRAEALVQPRQEGKTASGLGSLVAQLGGIADMTGMSLGSGGDRAVAIATLKSRTLIEAYIAEKKLLPRLYERKWDAAAGTWKTQDPKKVPTVWQAYNDFTTKIFRVTEDKKTGLVSVSVEWKDPAEAQLWVTELIARANELLRAVAIREGERNLAYLEEQARKIGQVELQRALYSLVETELKKLMLAKGGEEFAIKTIDRAVVPMKRVRPDRVQLAVVGFVLGCFVGIVAVLVRSAYRR